MATSEDELQNMAYHLNLIPKNAKSTLQALKQNQRQYLETTHKESKLS
jgi:hypothetical protein